MWKGKQISSKWIVPAKIGVIMLYLSCTGCEDQIYIPKPMGYARIDFPAHAYRSYVGDYPFTFEYAQIGNFQKVENKRNNGIWFNIAYPNQKAKIHFSYIDIKNKEVAAFISDTRKLALAHLEKADDFEESTVMDSAQMVYGMIYDFKGSTASNIQFYLTDSVQHFIRGALYFEVTPNADSIAPSEIYIEEDIAYLINTFRWK